MSFIQLAGGIMFGLLKRVATSPTFQAAAVDMLRGIGQSVLDNKNNPAKLVEIGTLLAEHPKNTLGTIVKGTDAEKLVSPSIIVDLPDHGGSSPGGAG